MEEPSLTEEEWVSAYATAWQSSLESVQEGDRAIGLLNELISTQDLSTEEITAISISLRIAGGAPMAHFLGMSLYLLLQQEDLRDQFLVSGPSMRAVDELLRYVPTNNLGVVRIATAPTEIVGSELPAGAIVFSSLPTANRDPHAIEDPELITFGDHSTSHLAFGYGPHRCVGQNLARTTARIAIARLFKRLPEIKLAVPAEDVPMISSPTTHGVSALPVSRTT